LPLAGHAGRLGCLSAGCLAGFVGPFGPGRPRGRRAPRPRWHIPRRRLVTLGTRLIGCGTRGDAAPVSSRAATTTAAPARRTAGRGAGVAIAVRVWLSLQTRGARLALPTVTRRWLSGFDFVRRRRSGTGIADLRPRRHHRRACATYGRAQRLGVARTVRHRGRIGRAYGRVRYRRRVAGRRSNIREIPSKGRAIERRGWQPSSGVAGVASAVCSDRPPDLTARTCSLSSPPRGPRKVGRRYGR